MCIWWQFDDGTEHQCQLFRCWLLLKEDQHFWTVKALMGRFWLICDKHCFQEFLILVVLWLNLLQRFWLVSPGPLMKAWEGERWLCNTRARCVLRQQELILCSSSASSRCVCSFSCVLSVCGLHWSRWCEICMVCINEFMHGVSPGGADDGKTFFKIKSFISTMF